ncbi:hypothetical protein AWJ15_09140 [Lacticaseibacillus rhamnosus]|nr:hypothetical protein AWJ15_09140 [Lacticaseibacillus rhamnosus]
MLKAIGGLFGLWMKVGGKVLVKSGRVEKSLRYHPAKMCHLIMKMIGARINLVLFNKTIAGLHGP